MEKTFGSYVKHLRGSRTKKEIANKAGFTPEYLRRIEDQNKIPSQDILIKLAKGLDVDEKEFLFQALAEKAPETAKKYFDLGNRFFPLISASSTQEVIHPNQFCSIDPGNKEELSSCNIVHLKDGFLKKEFPKAKKILIVYLDGFENIFQDPLIPIDFFYFLRHNDTHFTAGVLIKKNPTSLIILDAMTGKEKKIEILDSSKKFKNILSMVRVIGVLF
jgi:transcriptional regulator with XRE-family HTH domain